MCLVIVANYNLKAAVRFAQASKMERKLCLQEVTSPSFKNRTCKMIMEHFSRVGDFS